MGDDLLRLVCGRSHKSKWAAQPLGAELAAAATSATPRRSGWRQARRWRGYTSDQERTSVDFGWNDPACPREPSIPDDYGQGVATPHASFLALDFARDAALRNLANLERDFDIYGEYGFYDAVNVTTGEVSPYYLALDQGMIMAALGNELRHDRLQRYMVDRDLRRHVRPLLRMEQFTAGPTGR